jgi:carboxyl-terminal processing protease
VQNIIELDHGRAALKLTTAAYRRPSGKNIHRFPDAKDKDEWGVMPDLGYELGLDDRETQALADDRRHRDIIAAHGPADDKSAAVLKDEPLARRFGGDKLDAGSRATDSRVKPSAVKKPFVDRQLEMAMKYLRDELTKKSRIGGHGAGSHEG